jgi:hypothetical protein
MKMNLWNGIEYVEYWLKGEKITLESFSEKNAIWNVDSIRIIGQVVDSRYIIQAGESELKNIENIRLELREFDVTAWAVDNTGEEHMMFCVGGNMTDAEELVDVLVLCTA